MPLKVIDEGKLPGRMARVNAAVHRGLIVAGGRVMFRWVAIIEGERPGTIATGRTWRSIHVSKVHTAVALHGGVVKYVEVGPTTAYAKWGIGFGRSPGTPPPFRYILSWVREKPGGRGLTRSQAWILAKTVQQTIAERGTTAYHTRTRAVNAERKNVFRIVRLQVRAALRS